MTTYGYARGYEGTDDLDSQLRWLKRHNVPIQNVFIDTPQDLTKAEEGESLPKLLQRIGKKDQLYVKNILDLGALETLHITVFYLANVQAELNLETLPSWLPKAKRKMKASSLLKLIEPLWYANEIYVNVKSKESMTSSQRAKLLEEERLK